MADSSVSLECPEWCRFLRAALGDEQAKIDLLQEWFGLCTTPDTSMRKLMFFRGPTSAGKSVVLNTLYKIVGDEQACIALDLAVLGMSFVEEYLSVKSVCIVEDCDSLSTEPACKGMSIVASVTYGISLRFRRRHHKGYDQRRLPTRFTLSGEDLPHVGGEPLRHFLECVNVIEFKRCLVGYEGPQLESLLSAEMPGIAAWAAEGLTRLRANGRFTMPVSSAQLLRKWSVLVSPLTSFVDECCEDGDEVTKDELFDAWVPWSRERRICQLSQRKFNTEILATFPSIAGDVYEKEGRTFSVYRGLKLKQGAAARLVWEANRV
jgi:phage/plasmid-associated DNA primase